MKPIKFILVIVLSVVITSAQETTPEPEGPPAGLIAFISGRNGSNQLFVMDTSGENVRQLTHGNVAPASPAWSPDGTQIVYSALGASGREIFVIDADGENRRQLTDNSHVDSNAIWSPDGTQLIYSATPTSNIDLMVLDLESGDIQQVMAGDGTVYADGWIPDTRWIIVTRQRAGDTQPELYLVDADAMDPEVRLTEWDSNDLDARVSPDGTRVFWVSNRNGFEQVFSVDLQFLMENAPIGEGTDVIEQVTHGETGLQGQSGFDFSPDGRYLVLTGLRNNVSPFDNVQSDIYLFELSTGLYTPLTTDGYSGSPSWQPIQPVE